MNGFAVGLNNSQDNDHLPVWSFRCDQLLGTKRKTWRYRQQNSQELISFFNLLPSSCFENSDILCLIFGYLLPNISSDNHAKYFAECFLKEHLHFLCRVQGAFFIYLHNKTTGSSYFINDHLGINTGYYFIDKNNFIAATHLKLMLAHPGVSPSFNWIKALQYGDADPNDGSTLFNGVYTLPAGSIAEIKGSSFKLVKYLDIFNNETSYDFVNKRQAIEYYKNELEAAINLRMQMPVATASFLSGGLDSSVIAMLAKPDKGFSIVNPVTYQIGDTERAYLVSKSTEAKLYFIAFSQQNLPVNDQLWLKILWETESPSLNIGRLIKYLTHECIDREYPLPKALGPQQFILSGLGADQFNGGIARTSLNNDGFAFDNLNHWDAFYEKLNKLQWCEMVKNDSGKILNLRSILKSEYIAHAFQYNYQSDPWQYYLRTTSKEFIQQDVFSELRIAAVFGQWMQYPYLDTQLIRLIKRVPTYLYKELFFDKMILRSVAADLELPFDVHLPKIALKVAPRDDPDAGIYYRILFKGKTETLFMQQAMAAIEKARDVFNVEALKSHIYHSLKREEKLFSTWLINIVNLAVYQEIMYDTGFLSDLHAPENTFTTFTGHNWQQIKNDLQQTFNLPTEKVGILRLDKPYQLSNDCALLTDNRSGQVYVCKGNQLLFTIPSEKIALIDLLRKMLEMPVIPVNEILIPIIKEEEIQAILQVAESLDILQQDKNFEV